MDSDAHLAGHVLVGAVRVPEQDLVRVAGFPVGRHFAPPALDLLDAVAQLNKTLAVPDRLHEVAAQFDPAVGSFNNGRQVGDQLLLRRVVLVLGLEVPRQECDGPLAGQQAFLDVGMPPHSLGVLGGVPEGLVFERVGPGLTADPAGHRVDMRHDILAEQRRGAGETGRRIGVDGLAVEDLGRVVVQVLHVEELVGLLFAHAGYPLGSRWMPPLFGGRVI